MPSISATSRQRHYCRDDDQGRCRIHSFGLSGIMFNGQHDDATIQRIGHRCARLLNPVRSGLGLRVPH